MTVLKAEDMHCGKCVERIEKAFAAENMKIEVKLEDKTVSVDGDTDTVQKAKEILDDLGFEAVEI
jgi:copper chaperone